MKKVLAFVLALALAASLFAFGAFAEDIAAFADKSSYRSHCDDFSYTPNGDAASVHIRGWVGFDQAMEKIGYVIDDGAAVLSADPNTGCEDAVKDAGNAGPNGARYDMTFTVEGVGTHTLKMVAKLADGTLAYLGIDKEVEVKSSDARTVAANVPTAKYLDGEVYGIAVDGSESVILTVKDSNPSGKDWVGLYPDTVDPENITSEDSINWWCYVDGETLVLNAENFKTRPVDLNPGKYYIILFDNDGYTTLDYTKIEFVEAKNPYVQIDIFGDATKAAQAGDLGKLEADTTFNVVGWITTDKAFTGLKIKVNGVETEELKNAARNDAENAFQMVFSTGVTTNINVPANVANGTIEYVVTYADGTTESICTIVYQGTAPAEDPSDPPAEDPSNPPAEDPTDTPDEPQPPMADTSLVVFVLAAAAIALVVLKKKAF